ncbi:MAG: chemotaxis protein CheW [Xenococcaceae cyanobacterium MO_167.B27]|nr:chemotaxis protein CheW [Xenococcaceae cyanobacterium MO_167.B27]
MKLESSQVTSFVDSNQRKQNLFSLQQPYSLDKPEYQDGERFLSFALNPEVDGLLALKDLRGVIKVSVTEILPIPEVEEFFLGVINCQGEAAWILDLPGLLGSTHWCRRQPVKPSGMGMLIVVQNQTIGLLVEQVKGIEIHDLESCLPATSGMFPDRLRIFLKGYFLDRQDQPSILLDLEVIIQALRLNTPKM